MVALAASIATPDIGKHYDEFARFNRRRMEAAALVATDQAAKRAKSAIRSEFQAAGLGRLGNAFGSYSDLETGRGVHRLASGGFSASGTVLVRSRSRRSRGAIEAYTGGAEIRPTRGRFLWIATDQIPNRAGRFRMTPEGYRANGFEQRIGPLVFVKSVNGYPLLVVKDSSVSAVDKTGSARAHEDRPDPEGVRREALHCRVHRRAAHLAAGSGRRR